MDAQAGRLQYEAGPDVVSTTIALGLTRSTTASTVGLSIGIPFSDAEPLWGAVQGFRRLETSGAAGVGVDVGANGFAYRIAARDSTELIPIVDDHQPESGWGAGAEIMPRAFWQSPSGVVAAEARAGGVAFTSHATGSGTLNRTAFVADASLGAMPFAGLSLRLDGQFVAVREGDFPYVGAAASWTRRFTLWGSAGQWFHDAAGSLSWEAGVAVPFGDRIALGLTGEHEPIDPVYATPARTTWGAGVTVWLRDRSGSVPLPVPASYENGLAMITLDEGLVDGVPAIAGDFNQWTPTPMQREGDAWVHRAALAPGVYNYAFIDEAGNWFVPEETPGRHDDGMGGYVATLVVGGE